MVPLTEDVPPSRILDWDPATGLPVMQELEGGGA
jgi:hypothetical protein